MIAAISFIIFFSFPVEAIEFTKENDRLYISGNCVESRKIYASLARWNQNYKPKKDCKPLGETPNRDRCAYEVTNCVPDHVIKYHGVKAAVAAPNCFNLALVMSGIVAGMHYSSHVDMDFFMGPPLCRQLRDGEPREPGDIGTIRNSMTLHGFMYISDELAYSKDGFTSESQPYAIQSLSEMYKNYGVPDSPLCRKNERSLTEPCKRAVAFFRCDSMENYFEKNPDIPTEIREAFADLDSAESCVGNSLIYGGPLSSTSLNNLRNTGAALVTYLDRARDSSELKNMDPEKRQFLLGALKLRLNAMAGALLKIYGHANDDDTEYTMTELDRFRDAIRDASDSLSKTQNE